jgi:hypothetical protein
MSFTSSSKTEPLYSVRKHKVSGLLKEQTAITGLEVAKPRSRYNLLPKIPKIVEPFEAFRSWLV